MKKGKLHKVLYNIHLKAAQEWVNLWYTIQESIHNSINLEMENKYRTTNQKLTKLEETHTPNPKQHGESLRLYVSYHHVEKSCVLDGVVHR
jgi:hypothetical protein